MVVHTETAVVLFSAGLIFLWALILGVWKWQAMTTSPDGLAHPYVDIAHRAALLYAFATGLIAAFVELSGWPSAVDFTAAAVMILLFVVTIANYVRLGASRETDNQMRNPPPQMRFVLAALIIGEIGGFSVLLTGFAIAQF
ncbi:hypothetical protein [Nocardia donostiensis]|uniref:Integral membrane protein n=1 Tax=Nocardia donostiensis TaxID=1538463 RepID=A0A1W0AUA0_9NOCA|nr:hypothetical protein [Nocardia donostiensis]ONM48199.1 hypothetical protein B0T46_14580 [Nocardia donostiensis]OQS13810.1 hypothetical protein B0T36_16805 [Nocardia donostiensis]OQS17685.1 hypothetical protein B0T44_23460 [Nocardia donostiensis]